MKHDRQAAATGNVAIETSRQGRPSGIIASTAAWWAIVVGNEAILMKTDVLRRFVSAHRFREVSAGDNKAALARLVPLERLKTLNGAHFIKLADGPA